jgi:hypothetical protein
MAQNLFICASTILNVPRYLLRASLAGDTSAAAQIQSTPRLLHSRTQPTRRYVAVMPTARFMPTLRDCTALAGVGNFELVGLTARAAAGT